MAQGLLNQGAWSQLSQGAWQVQSQAYSDTLTDSVTPADALVADAGIALAESITPADALTADATKVLTDSITLADALIAYAGKVLADSVTPADGLTASGSGSIILSDSVTPADALVAYAAKVLADSVTPADALSASGSGGILLSDSVTPADTLIASAIIVLAESVTLPDLLSAAGGGSISLSDAISASDSLIADAIKVLSDSLTVSDSLASSGTSGIGTPIGYEAPIPIDTGPKGSEQGITNVTNRARPLCSLVTSGSNTIYTATSVEDTDGWDLSEVARHNVVATEDGYVGEVLSSSGNVVTVTSWHTPGGPDLAGKAADRPTDGQGATIHKVIRAASVLISADRVNDKFVWLGMSNAVTPETGFPISNDLGAKNANLTLVAGLGKHLNLSKIWVVAGSPQTLHWTRDGSVGEPGGSSGISGLSFVDRAHTSDALAVSAGKVLSDSLMPSDALSVSTGKALADSVMPSDALSVSAGKVLADSVSVLDSLSAVLTPGGGGVFILSDSVTPADALSVSGGKVLSDSVTPADALSVSAGISGGPLLDSVTPADALAVSAGISGGPLLDSVTPSDALAVSAGKVLADSVSLVDSLSTGVPGPPVMPIINDVAYFSGSEYVALAIQSVTYGHGLLIFDVTDPTNPVRVGWLEIADGFPIRIRIVGAIAYVSTTKGLTIVNIGNPLAPIEISNLPLYVITSPAPGIDVSGNRCYIANMTYGLKIINITDPYVPFELPGHDFDTQNVGTYAYPDQFNHGGFACGYFSYPVDPADHCFPYGRVKVHYFSGGKGVKIAGSFIYVSGSGRIWRLTKSDTPVVDRIWTVCQGPGETGLPESFDIAAGIPYVHMAGTGDINLCGQALAEGLNSISQSAPMTDGLMANLPFPKSIVSGGTLFTLRRRGISGVVFPSEVMDLTVGARGFTVNVDYLYVGVYSGGWSLRVYDISTLATPVLVGTGT